MKKLFITILLSVGLLYSQAQYQPNPAYGTINKRGTFDSTLFIPTGCGAPSGIASLKSVFRKQAAKYYDTCSGKEYTFNPKDSTWGLVGSGAITSLQWDSITGKPSLLIAGNNLADVSNVATARTNLNVYSKTEADARYLQSFSESDPVWSAAAANYYTKTQSDARYLQSFTETDPTVYAWAKAATKPAYAVAEITGLQTALDGKQNVLGFTPVPDTRTINGYALSSNISLSKTDVGLGNVPNTDATNPANISQSASYRFVTDSEKSTWNAKQNALGYTPENAANKGQANGYADLDANGKVPASRIDFSQTGQTFVVASQSAMLAVSGANVGAMAIRTDQSRTYVLIATPASTLANWVQLLSPDAPVQSVNGQTGNVNLLTTNIGEGTNFYYTDARARAALSAGTGISYNNTTGQISSTITQYTDALARAALSFAAGSGGYNSTTGVITIPTNTSQLTNGAGFLSSVSLTSNVTGVLPVANGGTGQTTIAGIQSALGLGSYAHRSSGLAELSGATFTGNVNIQNGLNGEMFFGNNPAYQGRIYYDGSVNGQWVFDNTYNSINANCGFVFRTRTSGTPVSALLIEGSGNGVISGNWRVGGATQLDGALTGTSATFNGNVGMGTTTPSSSYRLTLNGNASSNTGGIVIQQSGTDVMYMGNITATNTTDFEFWNPRNGYIRFATNNIERLRIDATGAITATSSITATSFNGSGSGLTGVPWASITGAPSFLTTAVTSAIGTANQITVSASTGAVTFSLPSAVTISGNMTAAGFFESSDIRLKNVFAEYTSADGINPILYTFKNEFRPKYGYSAQQVEKELSFAVQKGDDGFLKVDYTTVHTYKIMQLEKRIADLERRVNNGLPERIEYFPINEEKMLTKAKQK